MCIPNIIHYVCGHHITSYSANSTECNYMIHTEAVEKTTHRWPDSICPECCQRPFLGIIEKPEIVQWLLGVVTQEVYKRQREDSGERRSRGTSSTVATARRNRSASKEGKKKYERGNVFERAGG
ncbi:uncharacterized protein H6S33_009044 [Morchella sextelata]|jgi:hypothetical protein|uniref:uncharacterized protein n=1 Tax=Morchella sextelata TaxID=1174677 RepID=UPI001D059740|nr:uncharacterized protein H6S33_009044 [Morchella sextelata]KAH0612664.1 hypothetical protein H6S33_009044 [Morchella sextelata]